MRFVWPLVALVALACSGKSETPRLSRPAHKPTSGGTGPCARVGTVLPLAQVARTCGRQALGILEAGGRCTYRIGTNPRAAVHFDFGGSGADALKAAARALSPEPLRPAAFLGPRGRFLYERRRARAAFVFPMGEQAVTVSASTAYCGPGPLSRFARTLRQRFSRPTGPKK